MDPNAAVRWLLGQIDDLQRDHALDVIRGLFEWAARGGFPPDWPHWDATIERWRADLGTNAKVTDVSVRRR